MLIYIGRYRRGYYQTVHDSILGRVIEMKDMPG